MEKRIFTCDKCGKEWNPKESATVYTIEHSSIDSQYAIWGDNRFNGVKHFCKHCFDTYIYPAIK